MKTTEELDLAQLEAEQAEMLPDRSALGFFNFSDVDFSQNAWAFSIGGEDNDTFATNFGFVVVIQD